MTSLLSCIVPLSKLHCRTYLIDCQRTPEQILSMTKTAFPAPNYPRPLTTVDVVIFTALEEQLQVLLVKRPDGPKDPFPGRWALPGGFVDVEKDQSLEACALHKLKEKTGVDTSYLEQLGSWGSAERDPRGWSATHVYFALLPHASVQLERGAKAGLRPHRYLGDRHRAPTQQVGVQLPAGVPAVGRVHAT